MIGLAAFAALAPQTGGPGRGNSSLRQFFAHAHHTGRVLHDPTTPLSAPQHRGFRGPSLTLDHQRALYQRWTHNPDTHPHEALIGLAALLHAATTTELRHLTDDTTDTDRRTLHFPGRPNPTPLDNATWAALRRCLDHRAKTATANPHILTIRRTATTHTPAGAAHIRDSLAPAGLLPRILRSTRLLTLAHQLDIEFRERAGTVHGHERHVVPWERRAPPRFRGRPVDLLVSAKIRGRISASAAMPVGSSTAIPSISSPRAYESAVTTRTARSDVLVGCDQHFPNRP